MHDWNSFYPDSTGRLVRMRECQTVLHARAMQVSYVHENTWNASLTTALTKCVHYGNRTKTDWKTSSSSRSVQAASHCRFGAKQKLMYTSVYRCGYVTILGWIQDLSIWLKCLSPTIMWFALYNHNQAALYQQVLHRVLHWNKWQ